MKKLIITTLFVITTICTYAENTAWFQLSLTPDIAIQDRDTRINGVLLGIWNENPQSAWSIGMVNGSTGDSKGFSWLPYLTFLNYAENYKGVHWGWVSYASGNFSGWQNSIVNVTQGRFAGFQSALVNYADTMSGVQLGAVNVCNKATGVQLALVNYTRTSENLFQLGLVNFIADNAWFNNFSNELAQGFVIANWSFGDS